MMTISDASQPEASFEEEIDELRGAYAYDYIAINRIRAAHAIELAAARAETRKAAIVGLLTELRQWWSFDDNQRHTHSWHDRENFIEMLMQRAAAAEKEGR